MPTAHDSPARAAREALIAFVAVFVAVAVLVRINWTLPAVGHVGSACVALLFLYVPFWFAERRQLDVANYGYRRSPLAANLRLAAVVMLVVFPIFVAVYVGFYEYACHAPSAKALVPKGMCFKYRGWTQWHGPAIDAAFIEFCLVQLVVVALPEELFFRGFLLGTLEAHWPPARRWLGGGLGRALVVSALAFAVVHLPRGADPRALATFFPGLLFGWMRSKTGSILSCTVVHAGSNILVRLLEMMVMR